MKTNVLLSITIAVLLALFTITFSSFKTQSPALINYQAVVRDANGSLITSGAVSLGISIHDAITGGNQLYFETHSVSPNSFGVVNVAIGGGTVVSGNFLVIDWSNGNKYLQVYINNNPIGGRTQMVSVPFSLYANNAKKADSTVYATTSANALSADNLNLPGVVLPYTGTNPPAGWLFCDGSSYPISQYPNLYAIIGTSFGGQSGNFNIPDMRGRFMRGVDGGASNDPDHDVSTNNGADGKRYASNPGGNTGNSVGSLQNDENKSHTHILGLSYIGGMQIGSNTQIDHVGNQFVSNPSGGNESRPKNVYFNFIIKY